MKVFLVYPDENDYDCYDGLAIAAETSERAIEIATIGYFGKSYFKEFQGKIHAVEVDLCREGIILESFNAG